MGKDENFLKDVKERYRESVDGWDEIYREARNDLDFCYDVGEGQWPAHIRGKREAANRPVLTVNKLQKFVRRHRGDMMQNRPRVKVIPVDNQADVQKAKLYNDLIRQIEYLSRAEIAYDTAYNGAVSSSIGFFRLITQYDDDKSFNQSIYIKRIINPLSVHFDPYAQEFTLEDAQYCFIEDLLDEKAFKRLYPKAEKQDFDNSETSSIFGDWLQSKKVRVAEYFYKDSTQKKLLMLADGTSILEEKNTIEALKLGGHEITRERMVDIPVVKWCKLTGAEILEETTWPGKYIPIVPVLGDEVVAEGRRHYLSLIRGAKGPQQMLNYWMTAATETVALAPKNPFIVEKSQIEGFEGEWEDANIENRMYIRYNAQAGLQKPAREPQVQIPTAIMGLVQQTALDIEDHLGIYEASLGKESNERSGKAIALRDKNADKGTYTFVDNMTRAIVYAGRQIVDLIPKIYDTQRAVQIMGENGTQESVEINKPVGFDETGNVVKENDLTVGQFDLIATIGASYSSKRQEMVAAMTEAAQYAPTVAPYIVPLIFKYSDWPGSEEVYQEVMKGVQQAMAAQQAGAAK